MAPDSNDVVVEADGVSKHFGSLSVLSGVSFTARQGELLSLVGPNGAGKTTLIRCIADGRERSEGTVRIAGRHRAAGAGPYRGSRPGTQIPDRHRVRNADRGRLPAHRAHQRATPPSFLRASPVLALAGRRARRGGELGPGRAARRGGALPQPRPEAGARTCDGAGARAERAAARRADRGADQRRAQGFAGVLIDLVARDAAVRPAGRARSRFRPRDLLAHHRAAPGTRRARRHGRRGRRRSPDPRDLHRTQPSATGEADA